MTMITDLPRDLVKEIVSRVPLKSMKRVRLACKSWNTLTKSESFRKMHIRRAGTTTREGESQMIVKMGYNIYLVSVFANDPSTEIICKLTCRNEQVKISQVFHCDGLLLCILKEDDIKIVVCNPYWGQTRWIECRYSHRPNGWDKFSYALGYEDKKSCRSHKFLRFIDRYYFGAPKDQFVWYEIYDFHSGLWKTLDITPSWCVFLGSLGVSLKGNTYWPASQRNSKGKLGSHIICFDFTSERFGPLMPLPSDVGYVTTLSCVREEKLAVCVKVNRFDHDIWITTKIEAENVSWSKFLTFNWEHYYPITSKYFFIDEEKKVAMGIYEKTCNRYSLSRTGGYFKVLDLNHRQVKIWDLPHVLLCSKFSANPAIWRRGKHKQQSDLETRRFDENMLRFVEFEKQYRLRRSISMKC